MIKPEEREMFDFISELLGKQLTEVDNEISLTSQQIEITQRKIKQYPDSNIYQKWLHTLSVRLSAYIHLRQLIISVDYNTFS